MDVTHGKTPDGPADGVFELGSGVAVGMGPNLHRGLTKRLIKAAKANDIGYSLEVMEGNTGTNAWDCDRAALDSGEIYAYAGRSCEAVRCRGGS